MTGTVINEVGWSEHHFSARQVSSTPRPSTETSSACLIGVIWLGTDGARLHIFNALDETGLTNDPVVGHDNRLVLL